MLPKRSATNTAANSKPSNKVTKKRAAIGHDSKDQSDSEQLRPPDGGWPQLNSLIQKTEALWPIAQWLAPSECAGGRESVDATKVIQSLASTCALLLISLNQSERSKPTKDELKKLENIERGANLLVTNLRELEFPEGLVGYLAADRYNSEAADIAYKLVNPVIWPKGGHPLDRILAAVKKNYVAIDTIKGKGRPYTLHGRMHDDPRRQFEAWCKLLITKQQEKEAEAGRCVAISGEARTTAKLMQKLWAHAVGGAMPPLKKRPSSLAWSAAKSHFLS